MSTLTTLRSKLRSELKIDPNGKIWSDGTLNGAINQAVSQIQQDGNHDWHFNDNEHSIPTVINQSAYALPDTFVRLEEGTIEYDGDQLNPADYGWLKRRDLTTTSGQPSYYALRNANIYLGYRPNAIKTLEFTYRSALTAMSSDATDSGMPSTFDQALIKYAAYLCWSPIEGRSDKAQMALREYNQMMEGLFAQYLGRRDESNFNMAFETTRL
jgi:hypothetical protein